MRGLGRASATHSAFGEHQLTSNLREIFLTDDLRSELMRGRLDVVDKAIRKRRTIVNVTVPGIMPR